MDAPRKKALVALDYLTGGFLILMVLGLFVDFGETFRTYFMLIFAPVFLALGFIAHRR